MERKPKLFMQAIAEERAEYLRRHLINLDYCIGEMKKVPWWNLYKLIKYRLGILSMEKFIKPKILELINKYDIHAAHAPDFSIGYTNMQFTNFLLANKVALTNINKLKGIEKDEFLEKLNK